MKRIFLFLLLCMSLSISSQAATKILGTPVATPERMYKYGKSKGAGPTFTLEMCQEFYNVGKRWGVRGDIAICQSFIETGWFKYTGGTAVTPSDHNYCGLGVTTTGYKGCIFSTMSEGINAQLQHLWSYATTANLPSGWTKVDPRFAHGRRGWAPNWENLGSGNWASAAGYGNSIMSIYNEMMAMAMDPPSLTVSPSTVNLTAQEGATSNPKVNVTVKGSNLTQKLTYASVTGWIKVTPGSNWNEMTGGTLTLELLVEKGVKDFGSNTYVNIVSTSDLSKKVMVTGGVTAKPTPGITVSPTSLDFTAKKGQSGVSKTITVTGKNLSADMTYGSNSSMYTVTPGSNWNPRTGGTLTVSVNTDKEPGTYSSGYVYVQTSSSVRQQVSINTVILDPGASTDPTISVSPASMTINAEQNSSCSRSISVSAANLTQDISFGTNLTSLYTITPASDWNARTGGTLNIAVNTNRNPGTYAGGYIYVQSGSALRKQVDLTTVITAAATPAASLKVSPATLSLSAVRGSANPTATLTVTGENLNSDISFSASNSIISLSKGQGWNARTGGQLIATLDASSAVGTNSVIITVTSGTENATAMLSTSISEAVETPIPALDFKEIWNMSTSKSNADWAANVRNMDVVDGKMYAVYNTSEIIVADARTGVRVATLPTGGIVSGDTFKLLDVVCYRGRIYACNLRAKAGQPLRVYEWTSDESDPVCIFSNDGSGSDAVSNTVAKYERLGDCLDVAGEPDGNLVLTFGNGSNIILFERKSGSWNAQTIAIKNGSADFNLGSSPRVKYVDGGFIVNGSNVMPTYVSETGSVQESLTKDLTSGNDSETFIYDGNKYLFASNYLNNAATSNNTLTGGIMRLYDINNGWSKATRKADFPAGGLGSERNTSFSTSVAVNPCTRCVEAWVLVCGQGVAYYRSGDISGCTPDPGPGTDPTPGDEITDLPDRFNTDWTYAQTGKTISADYIDANTRNMTLHGDNLYVAIRGQHVAIVDAYSGARKGTLPTSGVTATSYPYASVASFDDAVLACNMPTTATDTLSVYAWTSDSATPSLVLSTTNHGARCGDLMSAYGSMANGKLYFSTNNAFSGYEGKVFVYTVTNGKAKATPEIITLKNANGSAFNISGGMAITEIRPNADGTFYASGKGGASALFNANGSLIKSFNNTAIASNGNSGALGSSIHVVDYGPFKLAASATYAGLNSSSQDDLSKGFLAVSNVTDGLDKAAKVHHFPVLGDASTRNTTFVTTALARVSGAKAHFWVLVPGQGIAKYSSYSSTSAVDDITAESSEARLIYDGSAFRVVGAEAASIAVYSLSGVLAATTNANSLEAEHLSAGIYVVVATLTDGSRLSSKVALR